MRDKISYLMGERDARRMTGEEVLGNLYNLLSGRGKHERKISGTFKFENIYHNAPEYDVIKIENGAITSGEDSSYLFLKGEFVRDYNMGGKDASTALLYGILDTKLLYGIDFFGKTGKEIYLQDIHKRFGFDEYYQLLNTLGSALRSSDSFLLSKNGEICEIRTKRGAHLNFYDNFSFNPINDFSRKDTTSIYDGLGKVSSLFLQVTYEPQVADRLMKKINLAMVHPERHIEWM